MLVKMISLQRKFVGGIVQIGLRNITTTAKLKKTYYDTLGLTRYATQADIKNAYFELSKLYHPDRISATDENLAKFREISAAYEILGNEQSRKLYDRGLLGEVKPGADETDEIADPIIKFYQKRQDLSKSLSQTSKEGGDEWAKHYLKFDKDKSEARKRFMHKVFLEERKVQEVPGKDNFAMCVVGIIMFLFLTNYENTFSANLWRKAFGS